MRLILILTIFIFILGLVEKNQTQNIRVIIVNILKLFNLNVLY